MGTGTATPGMETVILAMGMEMGTETGIPGTETETETRVRPAETRGPTPVTPTATLGSRRGGSAPLVVRTLAGMMAVIARARTMAATDAAQVRCSGCLASRCSGACVGDGTVEPFFDRRARLRTIVCRARLRTLVCRARLRTIGELVCDDLRSRRGSRTGSEGCRLGSDTDEPLRPRLARDHAGHRHQPNDRGTANRLLSREWFTPVVELAQASNPPTPGVRPSAASLSPPRPAERRLVHQRRVSPEQEFVLATTTANHDNRESWQPRITTTANHDNRLPPAMKPPIVRGGGNDAAEGRTARGR
jgi:hypothetical protein